MRRDMERRPTREYGRGHRTDTWSIRRRTSGRYAFKRRKWWPYTLVMRRVNVFTRFGPGRSGRCGRTRAAKVRYCPQF